jgi:CxxC motif-containing protein (DUF1111 family)
MPRRTVAALAVVAVPLLLAAGASATGPLPWRDDLGEADRAKVAAVLASPEDPALPEAFEAMQGGAGTGRAALSRDVLAQPAANLDAGGRETFLLGNALFRKLWVPAPSSTRASDGLGPLFNARACDGCHVRDGRGGPPDATGFVMRLSVPRPDGSQGPEPVYGEQIQDRSAPGLAAEGRPAVTWTEQPVTLADGLAVRLRRPALSVDALAYGPLDPHAIVSARIAPPMTGLGLLEAIHPGDILAGADPDDRDGDGISGRPNLLPDGAGGRTPGRFGWKASQPGIAEQVAAAFSIDMGLSTPLFPALAGDCTAAQPDCRARPHGLQPDLGDAEVPDPVLDAVAAYARTVAVPIRREAREAEVLRGKAVFHAAGCAACHRPKFVTRRDAAEPALAFQLIWPYSDLLLHDMGPDLADGRLEGEASGTEWRTPPLWGLGLARTANPDAAFLHDGRARDPLEAVLWHGGEAQASRDAVVALSREDRDALLSFLSSL